MIILRTGSRLILIYSYINMSLLPEAKPNALFSTTLSFVMPEEFFARAKAATRSMSSLCELYLGRSSKTTLSGIVICRNCFGKSAGNGYRVAAGLRAFEQSGSRADYYYTI